MKSLSFLAPILIGLLCTCFASAAADKPSPLQRNGDPYMGDWQGRWGDRTVAMQVIALGNDLYSANVLEQFDTHDTPVAVLKGKRSGDVVMFRGHKDRTTWEGRIESGVFSGSTSGSTEADFALEPIQRLSPTLGAAPPEGAIVLFDGTSLDGWVHPVPDTRVLNLDAVMGGDNRVAYMRSQVWSPKAQDLRLEMGSDDGIKAWLNGVLVHANNAARGASPGQDAVDVSLHQGWNTLLLKIIQAGGGAGGCAQFVALDGATDTGLYALRDEELRPVDAPRVGTALDGQGGAILDWQVSGPYSESGADMNALFDLEFAPEKEKGAGDWHWILNETREPEACRWKLLDTGVMEVRQGGIVSTQSFKDHKLHVEFRTPFMPEARGQSRGNSGVYLQGRYEVQVLDSYGLEGKWDECGGIYSVSKPRVNMAAPPLQWQTYDITFTAPRFDESGQKTQDAMITVLHNGVLIHEDVAIPNATAAHIGGDIREAQGLHLQDHGNPVQFRNIWAVALN